MHRNYRIKKRPKSDYVLIENISKAKTRKRHQVNLQNKDPSDVEYFLKKMKNALRIPKSRQMGSTLNIGYNPLANDEDIWFPSRNSDYLTPRQKTRIRRKQRRRNK